MERKRNKVILPSRMTPKDFMMVLENSLDWDKAAEEKVVYPGLGSDVTVTVVFVRPSESMTSRLSGIDEQIVKLQSGLRCLESCTESAPITEDLRAIFDFTKGSYFYQIRNEVISCARLLLPLELKDVVNIETAFNLTSSVFEDMLQQINSALTEMEKHESGEIPPLIKRNMAQNLLESMMKKLQDFELICRVCGWLRASVGSSVGIHAELEATVSSLTAMVVGAVFQSLLGSTCEGTSKVAIKRGLDTPLRNFLQAVADNITAETAATSETVTDSEGDKCHKTRLESVFDSKLESSLLAAASEVASALVSELKSTFKKDVALADPSVNPALYTTQVQMVSDKALKSIQAKIKEVLVADIFSRVNGTMNTESYAQLKCNLLSGSKQIIETFFAAIMSVLLSEDRADIGPDAQFQQSVLQCLIMYSLNLSNFCKVSDAPRKCRGITIKVPKIHLPKRLKKNRVEPMAVPTGDLKEIQPVSTEEPSTSQAPGTSAAVPYPKRKGLFSRISVAVSKLFCIGCRKSCQSHQPQI